MNKVMKKILIYIVSTLIISLTMSIGFIYFLHKKEVIEFNIGNGLEEVTISRVVDGDTIVIIRDKKEERVRLIGIDTPESVHPDEEKNTNIGKLASDFAETILKEDMKVYMEFDTTERDYFGRLLAYIWTRDEVNVTKEKDMKKYMVNAILLEEGYAVARKYQPNVKNHEFFMELQNLAEKDEKGLWKDYNNEMKGITE